MRRMLSVFAMLLAVGGCSQWDSAPAPDYRIGLIPNANGGMTAVVPACPNWHDHNVGFFQNDPWPQYGCSSARNLALMVARPKDLVEGRPVGNPNAEITSAAMERYITGKTTPLMDPTSKAPTANNTASSNSGASAIGAAMAAGVGAP